MLKSLMMLKGWKVPGSDGVPTKLVKDAAKTIAKPLMMKLNAPLANWIVPNVWKLSKVTPLVKSGARNEKNNYRLISVLPVFATLFEKIAHDQLSDFPISNRIHVFFYKKKVYKKMRLKSTKS